MHDYSQSLGRDKIQLTITSWILDPNTLFEYNSVDYNEREQFRAITIPLPIPKKDKPVYYFFHLIKKKIKEDRYQYFLERRKELISDISDRPNAATMYKLMGGVRLSRQEGAKRDFVLLEAIPASKITRKQAPKLEQAECSDPFAVVRTFKHGFPVRQMQTIRFGKIEFDVVEVNTSVLREVDYGADNDKVLNLDDCKEANMLSTTQKQEEGQSQCGQMCRVCLGGEEGDENPLLSPCKCSGTGRFIHLQCLREWIHQKLKKMKDQGEGAFYQTNLLFCEICKQKFPRAVIKNGKTHGLLKFLQETSPYIALKTKDKLPEENMYYISFEGTNEIKVGRLAQNGVVLQQQSVSRKHATIELQEHEGNKRIILKDADSKYGTLVREDNLKFRLDGRLKAFQIMNAVFSFKIFQERNY